MKEVHINNAILDIVKINGKDVLVIDQTDNDGKGIDYIYIKNFRIQDWRNKDDGELLMRSNHENTK
jgi:hypothetical protein|tara:strand:- start:302 stop:499 length:198 start_codon:yes stop_codon:yes gene_type:complete